MIKNINQEKVSLNNSQGHKKLVKNRLVIKLFVMKMGRKKELYL